jgi:hypothetical protein
LVQSIHQVLRDNLRSVDAERMKVKIQEAGDVCDIE